MTVHKQLLPKQHKVNINLVTQDKIICHCGSILWQEVVLAMKVPALIAGTPQDQLVLTKILQCTECKSIFKDHLPLMNEPKENNNEPTKILQP